MKKGSRNGSRVVTVALIILLFGGVVLFSVCGIGILSNTSSFAQIVTSNRDLCLRSDKRGYSPGEKVIIKIKIGIEGLPGWGENIFTATINDPAGMQIWQESFALSSLRPSQRSQGMARFILSYQLPEDSAPGKYRISGNLSQKDGEIIEKGGIDFNLGIPAIERFELTKALIQPGDDALFNVVISNPNPAGERLFDWQLDLAGPKGTDTISSLSMGREMISGLDKRSLSIPFKPIDEPFGDYSAMVTLREVESGMEYDQKVLPLHIGDLFFVTLTPKKRSYAAGDELDVAIDMQDVHGMSPESISIQGEIRDFDDRLIDRIDNLSMMNKEKNRSLKEGLWQARYVLPSDMAAGRYRLLGEIRQNGAVIAHCSKVFQVRGNIEIDLRRIRLQKSKKGKKQDQNCICIKNIGIQGISKDQQGLFMKAFLQDLNGMPVSEQVIELELGPKNKKGIKSLELFLDSNNTKNLQLIISVSNDEGIVQAKNERTVHLK